MNTSTWMTKCYEMTKKTSEKSFLKIQKEYEQILQHMLSWDKLLPELLMLIHEQREENLARKHIEMRKYQLLRWLEISESISLTRQISLCSAVCQLVYVWAFLELLLRLWVVVSDFPLPCEVFGSYGLSSFACGSAMEGDEDLNTFEELLELEEYIDHGQLFTTHRIFNSKVELVDWAKETVMKANTYLIINRYLKSRTSDRRSAQKIYNVVAKIKKNWMQGETRRHIDQNVLAKLTEMVKDEEVATWFVNGTCHKLINEIDEAENRRKLDGLKTKWQTKA
ncbi:hypothetical protein M9H77_13672 [Catharanthus roseus]|uniref:Uncharacterized protein n=1 Tax=Catharanthus roseus TaxID=4058 RepID=A0ACC0BL01_CATRO|nr:hypothetical protein M9H77_13672 [Catharanthus roseus]